MHLEQHSLIQVCDLSENQIPVISPAIWPPRTCWPRVGGSQEGQGAGLCVTPRASSLSCRWEGRAGCGVRGNCLGHPGQKMPEGAFWGW